MKFNKILNLVYGKSYVRASAAIERASFDLIETFILKSVLEARDAAGLYGV